MKRIAAWMVVLVLWAGLLLPAGAAPGDAALLPPEGQGSFYAMASWEGTLYLLSETGLYAWKQGETAPALLGTWPEAEEQNRGMAMAFGGSGGTVIRMGGYFIDHLMAWDGKLYGLDTDEGVLYLLEVSEGAVSANPVQSLQWDAMAQAQGDFSIPPVVSSPVLVDGYLYLLKMSLWMPGGELVRFSLADGSRLSFDAPLLAGFAPYTPGKALVLQYASQEQAMERTGNIALNILDLDTGEVQKGLSLPVATAEGLAYDPAADLAAFFSSGEVYAVDGMAVCRLAAYAPAAAGGFTSAPAQMLPGSLYALCGEEVSVRSIAKGQEVPRALRIQNAVETGYREFGQKRPDVPVVLQEAAFDSAEMMMQSMAAGSADLYGLSIDALDYRALAAKGYAASLSQSDMLVNQVKAMYGFLQEELFAGGELVAFPVGLSGQMLGYSKSALSELGLTESDLPRTFGELMEFITNWEENFGIDHPSLALFEGEMYGDPKDQFFGWLLENYMAHYQKIGQALTFDTPLMEKLLASLEAADFSAMEAKDVQKAMSASSGVTYTFVASGDQQAPTALFTMYQDAVPSEYGFFGNGFSPLPIVLEEGLAPAVPARLTVYVVNPYSKNKDLAIAYLEHLAATRSDVAGAVLSPQKNEPVMNPQYGRIRDEQDQQIAAIADQLSKAPDEKKKELQEALDAIRANEPFLESMKWTLSAEDLAAYRERAQWIAVRGASPLMLVAQDQSVMALMGRYMDGQITRTQLLTQLEQKLQMVYREGQ